MSQSNSLALEDLKTIIQHSQDSFLKKIPEQIRDVDWHRIPMKGKNSLRKSLRLELAPRDCAYMDHCPLLQSPKLFA